MIIRKAAAEDLPVIRAIYERGRRFMAEHGNPTQWQDKFPADEEVVQGVAYGTQYVCCEDGRIAATFFIDVFEDPTYAVIWDGAWIAKGPYGVVHRLAAAGTVKGAGRFCLQWAFAQCGHIRVDTHADNYVMQNLLDSLGYTRCGIIATHDGTDRIAYEKTEEQP